MSPGARSTLALAFANVGHTYSHLFMLLYLTVVLALEDEFGLSYGTLEPLATFGFIAFGVCALPAGWLGDRWSATGMMAVFFVGTGAASILTGFARSPLEIAGGLTLIGLFASIYHPVGTAWVVRHAVRRGKALGFNGLMGNWGIAGAALVAGTLTDLIGWRAAFIVPGVVCVATGAAFLLFVRAGVVSVATADRAPRQPAAPRADVIRVVCVLVVASLCGGLVFQASSVGLPKVFDVRLTGIANGTLGVGVLVSLVYFVAGFAQIVVGHLVDRFPARPVYAAIYALQVPLLFAAAQLFDTALLAVAIAFVFLGVGSLPISDSLVARYAPPEWRARAYGAKFVVGIGVASLGVPMVGLIYAHTGGFAWLFITLSGFALVVATAALFLPPERRAAPAATPASAPGQAD